MANENPKKLPTLVDEDIVTVKKNGIFNGALNPKVLTVAAALTMVSLSSCADDKYLCDGYDYSSSADGNGSPAYDTGVYEDSTDFGGDYDTNNSSDASLCDYD
jgi:hypothetical protein